MESRAASLSSSTSASTPPLASSLVPQVLLLVLLGALSWLLVSWGRRCLRFRRLELDLPGPWSLPFFGNALQLIGAKEENMLDLALGLWGGHNSELSRISLFNQMGVFVSDPDHIAKVVRDRRFLDKPTVFYSPIADLLGDGLLTTGGEYWRRHRPFIQPAFHQEVLERFGDVFAEEAAALVERLRPLQGRDVEFGSEMNRAAAFMVLRTTLLDMEDDEQRKDIEFLVRNVRPSTKAFNARFRNPLLWPSAVFNWTAMGRLQAKLNAAARRCINRGMKKRTEEIMADSTDKLDKSLGFKERKTLLNRIMDAKLSKEVDFSDEEIENEIKTIFCTAIETSVTTLSFVFKMLSIRPDIQDRVYAEILEVFGDNEREHPVESAKLPRLEYTERVIKETLRIFPTVPFMGRHVYEDTELCGKTIPAETAIIINVFSAHRDPRHHPDPLNFDPDRFLPERAAKMHPYCYMPFSAGPRNCIGKQYAMMQMKSILSSTLRAYRLLPANDGITHPSQFPLTFDIVLRIVGGPKVRLEAR